MTIDSVTSLHQADELANYASSERPHVHYYADRLLATSVTDKTGQVLHKSLPQMFKFEAIYLMQFWSKKEMELTIESVFVGESLALTLAVGVVLLKSYKPMMSQIE